jgi:hypothetical protein
MNAGNAQRDSIAFWQSVTDAAAECVDQVLFWVAIGREVDPFAATSLSVIGLEGVPQPRATGLDL